MKFLIFLPGVFRCLFLHAPVTPCEYAWGPYVETCHARIFCVSRKVRKASESEGRAGRVRKQELQDMQNPLRGLHGLQAQWCSSGCDSECEQRLLGCQKHWLCLTSRKSETVLIFNSHGLTWTPSSVHQMVILSTDLSSECPEGRGRVSCVDSRIHPLQQSRLWLAIYMSWVKGFCCGS